jgi:competence protein ComGA
MELDIKKFSHELIKWGIEHQAQDLYILPKGEGMEVFFRYGKSKVIFKKLTLAQGEKLIFHFKFMGGMDVGERRKTQMGAATYEIQGVKRRLRLSTVGDFRNRESLVIRFLHHFGEQTENFFLPKQLQAIQTKSNKRGLYLFSGPVGSGKTTVMYKIAKQKSQAQQIISIEDPVEIEDDSFLQLQTNDKIDLTYETLIKVCLRHRPDILIIGEIRDNQTTKAAIRAALTGHTVFATVHARNIIGVVQRLRDLGSNQQELDECLEGIIYQRLLTGQSCSNHKEGILFDYSFECTAQLASNWNHHLRKVWAYGFISDQVFFEECDKTN